MYCVPQGSVIGTILFSLLFSDLSDCFFCTSFHLFADDAQLYGSCLPTDRYRTAKQTLYVLN